VIIIIYRDKQKNSERMEIFSLEVDTLQSSVTDVTNALKALISGLIDVSKLANSKYRIEIDTAHHDPNGPSSFPIKIIEKKTRKEVKSIDCCRARHISKTKSSSCSAEGLFDNFTKPITTTSNNKKQNKNNKKVEESSKDNTTDEMKGSNTIEMEVVEKKKDDEEEEDNNKKVEESSKDNTTDEMKGSNTIEMEVEKKKDEEEEEEDHNKNLKTKKQKQIKRISRKKKEDKILSNIVERMEYNKDGQEEENKDKNSHQNPDFLDADDLSGIFHDEILEDFEYEEVVMRNEEEVDNQKSTGIN